MKTNYMHIGEYHCYTCHNTYNPEQVRCKCLGNITRPCTEKCGCWFNPMPQPDNVLRDKAVKYFDDNCDVSSEHNYVVLLNTLEILIGGFNAKLHAKEEEMVKAFKDIVLKNSTNHYHVYTEYLVASTDGIMRDLSTLSTNTTQ